MHLQAVPVRMTAMPTVGFISPLRCPVVAATERGTWAGGEREAVSQAIAPAHRRRRSVVQAWAHMAQAGRLPLLTQIMLDSMLLIMMSDALHRDRLALQRARESATVCLASITFPYPQAILAMLSFPCLRPICQTLNERGTDLQLPAARPACTALPSFCLVPRLGAQSRERQEK